MKKTPENGGLPSRRSEENPVMTQQLKAGAKVWDSLNSPFLKLSAVRSKHHNHHV